MGSSQNKKQKLYEQIIASYIEDIKEDNPSVEEFIDDMQFDASELLKNDRTKWVSSAISALLLAIKIMQAAIGKNFNSASLIEVLQGLTKSDMSKTDGDIETANNTVVQIDKNSFIVTAHFLPFLQRKNKNDLKQHGKYFTTQQFILNTCLVENGYLPQVSPLVQCLEEDLEVMVDEYYDSGKAKDLQMVFCMVRPDITLDELIDLYNLVLKAHAKNSMIADSSLIDKYLFEIPEEFIQEYKEEHGDDEDEESDMTEEEKELYEQTSANPIGFITIEYINNILSSCGSLPPAYDILFANIYVATENVKTKDEKKIIAGFQKWVKTWKGQDFQFILAQLLQEQVDDGESILQALNLVCSFHKKNKRLTTIDKNAANVVEGKADEEDEGSAW